MSIFTLYTSYTDEQLLALLHIHDEQAFTTLYKRYWEKLFAVAANATHDEHTAKEIVQNVFYDLWKRRETLQVQYSLITYLFTAVKYQVINELAAKKRRDQYADSQKHLSVAVNDTLQQVDFDELLQIVSKIIKELPEKCRIVFNMRMQGYPQKEIASSLDISEKTVEKHLSIARNHLRSGLSEATVLLFFSNFL